MAALLLVFLLINIIAVFAVLGAKSGETVAIPGSYRQYGFGSEAYPAPIRRVSPVVAVFKRAFDILVSLFIVVLTLPLCVITAVLICLDSPGGAFFSQTRVGMIDAKGARLIRIYKFRTMRSDAEAQTGAVWAKKNDDRITRVGRIIRKVRIDEIPQILNVVRGEMSLIGPRPERPEFYESLEKKIPGYRTRTYGVLPGITGLAQCSLGYDTCVEDVKKKLELDLVYARSLSSTWTWLKMEALIVLKTIFMIAKCGGQ